MNKKILMLGWGYPPDIDGGLDIHVAELFKSLRALNVEVDLALPEDRVPEKEDVIPVDVCEGDMMEKARSLSSGFVELAKDYDIVHTHDWFGAEPGLKAKKYADVKWIATFHSLSSQRSRKPYHRMEELERSIVEKSDKLVAVSDLLAKDIKQEFGEKPEVIHNGFSKPEMNGKDIKKELGVDHKMILYIGRHAEQKGIEHLIYGFSKFLEEENATLVLGGEGHMKKPLQEFVRILGIEQNVVFAGFIPEKDLGDYYKTADVFVSPSINEPFGLTLTEAVSAGTPVVATKNGAEELLPPETLVKVDSDSESIKKGIKQALNVEIPEINERTWDQVAEETVEIYRELS